MLVDIGVNLAHHSFNQDRAAVLQRAQLQGVGVIVITGTSLKASEDALALCARQPELLFSTAGVHPHNAKQCDARTIPALRHLTENKSVVAVGECGLDFNRNFSPPAVQEQWFEAQIKLAAETRLPLFLHERDAHQRFFEMLKTHRDAFDQAVVHCFTGTQAELHAYLDLDLFIGITGWICDERRGLHLRELVKDIPLDRLMIETDAPFLTPRNLSLPGQPKLKNSRNEPAYLPYVAQMIAHSTGHSVETIAAATTENALRFFALSHALSA
jgi:TatD DNase family protein